MQYAAFSASVHGRGVWWCAGSVIQRISRSVSKSVSSPFLGQRTAMAALQLPAGVGDGRGGPGGDGLGDGARPEHSVASCAAVQLALAA